MKKSKETTKTADSSTIARPPVVVIMGHVDHGKSTLLDYIRKTNIVDKEVGGITQRLGAYEIVHKQGTADKRITFLDTPGHEAFQGIRARGAKTADVAVLVVSAEDGVKPQTIQARDTILAEEMPYIVAINKIDRPSANIERTKQSLAENEIYLEGYGGNISVVPISAKTGEGVPDLLEMILLAADLEDLKADSSAPAKGVVIETHVDKKKGNVAMVIINDGTLTSGQYVVAETHMSPIRIFEDFMGKSIKSATFSSPVRIVGWDTLPEVGDTFVAVANKKEAEAVVEQNKHAEIAKKSKKVAQKNTETKSELATLPLVLKATEAGGLEALHHELAKIKHEAISIRIVSESIGDISETDIKTAGSVPGTIIVGFGVGIDTPAKALAENQKTEMHVFDIIYKLTEWLSEYIKVRAPKITVEKMTGQAKILKTFSRSKDKQILGGRVESGTIKVGEIVKVLRRENEIERGRIRELQQQKNKATTIEEGKEFGAMIECKVELMPGDRIEAFSLVEE